jgi:tetratricopeptide (TPR) repeat protein
MRLAWRAAGPGRLRALMLALALLSGCSLNPPLELDTLAPAGTAVRLPSVPFFAQTGFQCGPAALAGVLGAAGVATDPATLSPQVYLPAREGSLQLELVAATRRAGRLPYVLAGEPRALLAQLQAGRPVLVLQNLGTLHVPVWHYAVLTGFDAARNRLYLNSGNERELPVPAPQFLRTWEWAGRWAMVALQPGELPSGADPKAYLEAATAFERVADRNAASRAWQAAANAWPEQPLPHLALGNLAYGDKELSRAAAHYRRGLALDPDDPALANNLASVLGALGCPRRAEALLRPLTPALADGSPWKAAIDATLKELAAQTGADRLSCAQRP